MEEALSFQPLGRGTVDRSCTLGRRGNPSDAAFDNEVHHVGDISCTEDDVACVKEARLLPHGVRGKVEKVLIVDAVDGTLSRTVAGGANRLERSQNLVDLMRRRRAAHAPRERLRPRRAAGGSRPGGAAMRGGSPSISQPLFDILEAGVPNHGWASSTRFGRPPMGDAASPQRPTFCADQPGEAGG
eukprot:scaffold296210_cov29-Tisochrysis_lutea.AAC.3